MTGILVSLLVGVVLAAAGAIWGFVSRARLTSMRADRDKAEGALAVAISDKEIVLFQLRQSELARKDEAARLEAVIARRGREIEELTAELAKCSSPAAVNAQLNGLVSK